MGVQRMAPIKRSWSHHFRFACCLWIGCSHIALVLAFSTGMPQHHNLPVVQAARRGLTSLLALPRIQPVKHHHHYQGPLLTTTQSSPTALASSLSSGATGFLGLDVAVAMAAISATAKLLSAVALGGIAAKKPGVLDKAAISALSRLTFWVFQPAFLLSSVGLTIAKAASGTGGLPGRFLALMPVAALCQISLGALVGVALARWVPGMSQADGRQVQMSATFANSGPLPLIFSEALFAKSPTMVSDAAACISFYLLVWSPLFWTAGPYLLGTSTSTNLDKQAKKDRSSKTNAWMLNIVDALRQVLQAVRKILSPPVMGSLLGLAVGGIPLLRGWFFGGWCTPIMAALKTLGSAYLPAAMLVLAGSLVGEPPAKKVALAAVDTPTDSLVNGGDDAMNTMTSSSKSNPSWKATLSLFASRFLLSPLLSVFLVRTMVALGWLGGFAAFGSPAVARAQAMVTFVLLMEGCMPPAQNSVIMLQLVGETAQANSLAKLLTILYAGAVLPMTLLLSASLAMSGIMAYL